MVARIQFDNTDTIRMAHWFNPVGTSIKGGEYCKVLQKLDYFLENTKMQKKYLVKIKKKKKEKVRPHKKGQEPEENCGTIQI